jgi:hypothetical protein
MKNKSHSMEALETPTPSLKSFDLSSEAGVEKQQQQQPRKRLKSTKAQQPPQPPMQLQQKQQQQQPPLQMPPDVSDGLSSFLKKALRLEGPQLTQRTITIKKNVRESLGMRIGGGIGSNEGDTPIYVANIHPHGCIGKSKQLKVRSIRGHSSVLRISLFCPWLRRGCLLFKSGHQNCYSIKISL